MQKMDEQATMRVTYKNVCQTMEEDKPRLLELLKAHINLSQYIPKKFYQAFYKSIGRPRDYSIESLIWFTQLQNIIGIPSDKAFLTVLNLSKEVRDFCGFKKVPAESEITRFRRDFAEYIGMMFENLVEITEPICRMIDSKKSDYLLYDTTGVEANVKENNPKFFTSKLNSSKKSAKNNPELNPYAAVYSLLPETSETNPFVKQQYIRRTSFVWDIFVMLTKLVF